MNSDMQIAQTIIAQLGGQRFSAMTGARNMIATASGLRFGLPRAHGYCRDGINMVQITLDTASDLYSVRFLKARKLEVDVVSEHDGIYGDQLRQLFTRATGLETSLGTVAA